MKELQKLKFYCPLTIRREPDYDEEYDYGEEYPEIPSSAAAGYADAVQKRLEAYCSDDGKRRNKPRGYRCNSDEESETLLVFAKTLIGGENYE